MPFEPQREANTIWPGTLARALNEFGLNMATPNRCFIILLYFFAHLIGNKRQLVIPAYAGIQNARLSIHGLQILPLRAALE